MDPTASTEPSDRPTIIRTCFLVGFKIFVASLTSYLFSDALNEEFNRIKSMEITYANLSYKYIKLVEGGIDMTLLKWIGGIVIVFWILGLLFRIGGVLINWLLLIAAIVFIVDLLIGKRHIN